MSERPDRVRCHVSRAIRSAWSRSTLIYAGVIVSFVLLGLLTNASVWIRGPSHVVQNGATTDVGQQIWSLSVSANLLLHGHNPFFAPFVNVPYGVNLAANPTMLLLSVIFAPVTLLLGPVTTFNVAEALGFATSAVSMFFVARRFVKWTPAAYAAALLYGFSPYMIGQGRGHINLLTVPIPPLIFLVLYRIVRDQPPRYRRLGATLGLLAGLQFLISNEVLASTAAMALCGVLIYAAAAFRTFLIRAKGLATALVAAVVAFVPLGAYPMWMMAFGPQHLSGPSQSRASLDPLSVDPTGWLIPRMNQQFHIAPLAHVGDALARISASEDGAYLGLTLIVVLVVTALTLRRKPAVGICTALAGTAMILSLGERLHWAGHLTSIRLPFKVFTLLPFLDNLVAARFTLYVFLFSSIVLAIGLDHLALDHVARQRFIAGRSTGAAWLTALIVLIPLAPALPYGVSSTKVPAVINSSLVDHVALGTTVLTFPFPAGVNTQAMVWQALKEFRFKIPAGYLFAPPEQYGMESNSVVEQVFATCQRGARLATLTPDQLGAINAELALWHIGLIIITSNASVPTGERCAGRAIERVMNRPPTMVDGAEVWIIQN